MTVFGVMSIVSSLLVGNEKIDKKEEKKQIIEIKEVKEK
jgi:hypothetical protein